MVGRVHRDAPLLELGRKARIPAVHLAIPARLGGAERREESGHTAVWTDQADSDQDRLERSRVELKTTRHQEYGAVVVHETRVEPSLGRATAEL